jgi:hypothetical protein
LLPELKAHFQMTAADLHNIPDNAISATTWRVETGVGRLNQFLGMSSSTDENWCCDRCRTAAQEAAHAQGDRRATHYYSQAQHADDEIHRAGPEVIERRA